MGRVALFPKVEGAEECFGALGGGGVNNTGVVWVAGQRLKKRPITNPLIGCQRLLRLVHGVEIVEVVG